MLPRPLFFRLVLIFLIGTGCFSIGFLLFFLNQDRILLCLSILLFLFSIIKGLTFYHSLRKMKYMVLEGLCTGVTSYPFSHSCHMFLLDADGNASDIVLPKKCTPKAGLTYRIYLKEPLTSSGNSFLNQFMASDSFLGIELLETSDNITQNHCVG